MDNTDDPFKTLFDNRVETVNVRDLSFRLCVLKDLDEALDHYVKTSPSDTDMIPYFTRLWESAQALAEFLADHPEFCRNQSVLELGCGLGLPSMTAAALGGIVTSSDFHPDNEPFFLNNAKLNHLSINYHRMDWRKPDLPGAYDLLLGSDLIYEKQMVAPLAECVDRYCAANGTFILADPGRAALQQAATLIEEKGFSLDIEVSGTIFLLVFHRNAPSSIHR